ncbi:MAG: pth [Candidatus Saccharibacteria bacterium]|jgi:PTH1 family peptidyl-tRNA hydrolase|nr:pth [Candidatus Saccharibacteria bacterium]
MKLIVGLGNIGPRYARTRHNIGFMVVDRLAETLSATWKEESKLKAEIATAELEGEKVILAKPQTMMNLSGEAIQRIMQFYKLAPADIWVAFDEIDVPFGRLRIRHGGSGGGHQGVTSTIRHIGDGFIRFRIGISLNDRNVEPSEVYVLKPFSAEEQEQLPTVVAAAAATIVRQLGAERPEETTFDLM